MVIENRTEESVARARDHLTIDVSHSNSNPPRVLLDNYHPNTVVSTEFQRNALSVRKVQYLNAARLPINVVHSGDHDRLAKRGAE